MCGCVTGHRLVEYVQIIRWWSSNLGQWPLQNLGSVAMLNTLFYPSRPTCLSRLCIVLGSLLHPTAPPISSCLPSPHLSVAPAPHILSRCVAPSTWTLSSPATLQLPPIVSAPRTACLSLLSLPRPFSPRFRTRPAPRYMSSPGSLTVTDPSTPLFPWWSLPVCVLLPGILWFLVSVFVYPFRAGGGGGGGVIILSVKITTIVLFWWMNSNNIFPNTYHNTKVAVRSLIWSTN